jgi:hypothetical protein
MLSFTYLINELYQNNEIKNHYVQTLVYMINVEIYNAYTVHLRTNLDITKMEHRWKQHKKRKAHKKISFRNVALYNLIK